MKVEIKSILNDILEDIKDRTDDKEIMSICVNRIQKSKIENKTKVKMLGILSRKKGYFQLVKGIYDLILKYEGDGIITKSLRGGTIR